MKFSTVTLLSVAAYVTATPTPAQDNNQEFSEVVARETTASHSLRDPKYAPPPFPEPVWVKREAVKRDAEAEDEDLDKRCEPIWGKQGQERAQGWWSEENNCYMVVPMCGGSEPWICDPFAENADDDNSSTEN